jgi:hypothetical protein
LAKKLDLHGQWHIPDLIKKYSSFLCQLETQQKLRLLIGFAQA